MSLVGAVRKLAALFGALGQEYAVEQLSAPPSASLQELLGVLQRCGGLSCVYDWGLRADDTNLSLDNFATSGADS